MRLHPSAAERITLPLLTDDGAVEANGEAATARMLRTGDRSGMFAPDDGPTFTFHPLSPRDANLALIRTQVDVPRGAEAHAAVMAYQIALRQWAEAGREGPEPELETADVGTSEAYNQELAYNQVLLGLVSISGIPGCDGPPISYANRLPLISIHEISAAIARASEVPKMGKASSASAPKGQTQSTSSSGIASPASATAIEPPAASAAAHSPPTCSSDTPTPAPGCLGAPSTTAPSSDLMTAFT